MNSNHTITDIIENNMASVDDKVETGVKQLANASHYQVSHTNTYLEVPIRTYTNLYEPI